MGRCPRCGKELDALVFYAKEYTTYYFDGEGYERYESHVAEGYYACPYCDEEITADEEEAESILKRVEGHLGSRPAGV